MTGYNAYTPPPSVMPPRRPAWATVLAILCLVFGGFGVFGSLVALAMQATGFSFTPASMPGGDDEIMRAMIAVQEQYRVPLIITSLINLPVAAWMILIGVWLLKTKPWIRRMALTFACVDIVATLVATYVTTKMQMAMMDAIAQQMFAGAGSSGPPGFEQFMTTFMKFATAIGVVMGLAFGLAIPVFVLIWFNREKIKDQVAGWAPPSPYQPPYQPPSAS